MPRASTVQRQASTDRRSASAAAACLPQQRALELARGELGSSRSRLQLIEQELQVGGC